MRVLYLNIHDLNYPRNRLIRCHLYENGSIVDVVLRDPHHFFILEAIRLIWRSIRTRESYDFVILSELGVQYALFAKLIALRFRCPLIVDCFVGMYETNVGDWQEVSGSSIRARIYRLADWVSLRVANLALIDTDVRAEGLRAGCSTEVMTIPVGAPSWATPSSSGFSGDRLRILFYGNYAPLHGLPYIVNGLAQSKSSWSSAILVGNGPLRAEIEGQVRAAGLSESVSFLDSVPESKLSELIGQSDVVMGIFGDSNKARGVIANKVWQGVASGKFVVTRRSEALAEIVGIAEDSILMVDIDNSGSFPSSLRDVCARIESGRTPSPEIAEKLESYVERRLTEFTMHLQQISKR